MGRFIRSSQTPAPSVRRRTRPLKVTGKKEDPPRRKEDPSRRKEDPSRRKEDPSRRKEDPPRRKEDPSRRKEDPLEKKEDPSRKKEDPSRRKEDPSEKKEDPSRKKEDPSRRKEDPPRKKEDPSRRKEDPSEKKEDPPRKKEDPSRRKEDPSGKKEDPSRRKEDPSEKKEDPSRRKEGPSRRKEDPSRRKEESGERQEARSQDWKKAETTEAKHNLSESGQISAVNSAALAQKFTTTRTTAKTAIEPLLAVILEPRTVAAKAVEALASSIAVESATASTELHSAVSKTPTSTETDTSDPAVTKLNGPLTVPNNIPSTVGAETPTTDVFKSNCQLPEQNGSAASATASTFSANSAIRVENTTFTVCSSQQLLKEAQKLAANQAVEQNSEPLFSKTIAGTSKTYQQCLSKSGKTLEETAAGISRPISPRKARLLTQTEIAKGKPFKKIVRRNSLNACFQPNSPAVSSRQTILTTAANTSATRPSVTTPRSVYRGNRLISIPYYVPRPGEIVSEECLQQYMLGEEFGHYMKFLLGQQAQLRNANETNKQFEKFSK